MAGERPNGICVIELSDQQFAGPDVGEHRGHVSAGIDLARLLRDQAGQDALAAPAAGADAAADEVRRFIFNGAFDPDDAGVVKACLAADDRLQRDPEDDAGIGREVGIRGEVR